MYNVALDHDSISCTISRLARSRSSSDFQRGTFELLRMLLTQLEDKIVRSKRSTLVPEVIGYMRRQWRKCLLLSIVMFLS